MQKVIITAAVTGSRPTKAMNPAVPYTPEEIASAALDCWRAGAAIAHIHVRDPQTGAPSSRLDLFEEVLNRIRAESDLIVNLTTSGLNIRGSEEEVIRQRIEPASLRPEICSFDVGSLNFSDQVFMNPPAWGEAAAKTMQAQGVKPEIEVFDVGQINQAVSLIESGWIDPPPYFQLCMGVRWGIPASLENLVFMKNSLPEGVQWSVLGVGRHQLAMITLGILLGGHIRVGFEDNLYLKKGELADSNARFVEQAVELTRVLQREPASPTEAREILGLPSTSRPGGDG